MDAALKGDLIIPAPPPYARPNQKDFAQKFAEGAALGYARGKERTEQIQVKAEHDLDRSKGRE